MLASHLNGKIPLSPAQVGAAPSLAELSNNFATNFEGKDRDLRVL